MESLAFGGIGLALFWHSAVGDVEDLVSDGNHHGLHVAAEAEDLLCLVWGQEDAWRLDLGKLLCQRIKLELLRLPDRVHDCGLVVDVADTKGGKVRELEICGRGGEVATDSR